MTWVEGLGWVSAALAISGAAMKTIIPLRCLGIAMNAISLICSAATLNLPGIVANVVLLPVNGYRLVQMIKLVAKVRRAASSDLSMEWLKPFMSRRTAKAGEVLFAKGDLAECMTGRFRLRESGIAIPHAKLVGEMGFLSPDNRRTQTLECLEDGEVLTISYDELRQLYFQNPEFGFYFLRLTSERMFQNMAMMERELAELRPQSAERAA
jgi:CRP/FNR family cyclic AMP-dependent transcriptional regulator